MNVTTFHELGADSAAAGRVALLLAMAGCAGGSGDEEGSVPLGWSESALILSVHQGVDDVWTESERVNLTYCVSTEFGAYYPRAVQEMMEATRRWEEAAYVKFIHESEHDVNCAYPVAPVTFTVQSIFLGTGEAGAESFPPSAVHEGQYHYLGIALAAYDTLDRDVDRRTSLGAFSHELGHVLGFRHEHIRPEASQPPFSHVCFDEPVSEGYDPWRTISGATQYDPDSALHYGTGSCGPLSDFALTDADRAAAHAVYESPTRCEVWAHSTQLTVGDITAPGSASAGENMCETFAIASQQRGGLTYSTVERQQDHFRAIMIESYPRLEAKEPGRAASRSERRRDSRRGAERASRSEHARR